MNNLQNSINTPQKEKEPVLSLFRIPLNFFATDEELEEFHKNFQKLKDKAMAKSLSKAETRKMRKKIQKATHPKSRTYTPAPISSQTISTLKNRPTFSAQLDDGTSTSISPSTDDNSSPSRPQTNDTSTQQQPSNNIATKTKNANSQNEPSQNSGADNTSTDATQSKNEATQVSEPINEDVTTTHDTTQGPDSPNIVDEDFDTADEDFEDTEQTEDEEGEDENKKKKKSEDDDEEDDDDENKKKKKSEDDDDESNKKKKSEDNEEDDNNNESKEKSEDNEKEPKEEEPKEEETKEEELKDEKPKGEDPKEEQPKEENPKEEPKGESKENTTPKPDDTGDKVANTGDKAADTADKTAKTADAADKTSKAADTADKAAKTADTADKATKAADTADKAAKVADTADKASQAADAASTAADAGGSSVPGLGLALHGGKAVVDGAKAAEAGDEKAMEQATGELVNRIGAFALNFVPFVGAALSAIANWFLSTKLGKKFSKLIGKITCTGCIVVVALTVAVLFSGVLVVSSIFGTIISFFKGDKTEKEEENFMMVLQEDTLGRANKSIYTVLDDTLEKTKYTEYKDSIDNKTPVDMNPNGSTYLISMLTSNYSIGNLKNPEVASEPEDFPENVGDVHMHNAYYSMQSKHMPLFQQVLDNVLEGEYENLPETEQKKATKLKNLFNYDTKMVEFIDKLTEILDKPYTIFNPETQLQETDVTLRDLFNELSTQSGDTQYDMGTLTLIFADQSANLELITDFRDFQTQLSKLELLVYMQSYRQYQTAISELRRKANQNYILPDVYHTDDFFEQFSTITDVASYVALSKTSYTSSIAYEIACETINIWKDPPELTTKSYNEKTFAYIPVLETWYANYHFSLITVGENAILKCDGQTSRQLDEQSWENSSNLLKRYNITDKEKFFELYKRVTGTNPVEGEENIYTPYGMDQNWQMPVTFASGTTSATVGNYSAYQYSTSDYLTPTGGSLPLATNDYYISKGFMEEYSPETIEEFGLSHTQHYGIDYSVAIGTPVLAIHDGTVTTIKYSPAYGNYIKITDSNGYVTVYAHGNGTFNVIEGQPVTAGTQIMESGNSGNSSGAHLHVEVSDANGNLIDPHVYSGHAS